MKKHKKRKSEPRVWPVPFKVGLVAEYLKGGQTMEAIGAPHGLHRAQICQWVQAYSSGKRLLPSAQKVYNKAMKEERARNKQLGQHTGAAFRASGPQEEKGARDKHGGGQEEPESAALPWPLPKMLEADGKGIDPSLSREELRRQLEQQKLYSLALEALIEAAEEATGREIRKKTGPGQWKF